MPQGTFVPSHCSSFFPPNKGHYFILEYISYNNWLFSSNIFSQQGPQQVYCVRSLSPRFTLLSCATTLCSDSSLFFVTEKRFNLETFAMLGYIWSCERCGRIKKQRRPKKAGLARHLKLLESFWEHHGEKGASERDGGIKSYYLSVEFLTLFYAFVLWNMEGLVVLLLLFWSSELNTGSFCWQTL